jgi:hypothetical protein
MRANQFVGERLEQTKLYQAADYNSLRYPMAGQGLSVNAPVKGGLRPQRPSGLDIRHFTLAAEA